MSDGCTVACGAEGEGDAPALASAPDILERLADDLRTAGLVDGRIPAAKLIYLSMTSRLHERPVSVVIKGPSSAGKSWLAQRVLDLCPAEAYRALSAMSPRALAYGDEPMQHRVLVLFEAEGLSGDFASYLIRSLLSEGRIVYQTVESGPDGLKAKTIEREGPTGLLTTTTAVSLHPENETRLLSIPIADTRESTVAVFAEWGRAAAGHERAQVDPARWHSLGRWLATGERRVIVPFAPRIAELLPPQAIRLQRDLPQVLALVKAHALLHRASRQRDEEGRIIAVIDDYAVVRALVEPIVAAAVEATVPVETRRTVQAVAELLPSYPDGVPQTALGAVLRLDKSTISRRVKVALKAGYLLDLEPNPGRASRLEIGDAMPDDDRVLPLPEELGE